MAENQSFNIDKIYVGSEVREAGYVMPEPHCHSYYELFYVENGACRFFIDNNMYDIHSGDFMLIPPDLFHFTRYIFGSCKRSTVHFHREDLNDNVLSLLPHGEEFLSSMRIFQTPEIYREQINAHFLKMINEKKIADDKSEPMLQALLQELFLLCSRECRVLYDIPVNIHTTDRQIVLAAQFISNHYMEHIGASEIAAAAGYSPNYLSQKFRKSVGIGIHEYLVFIRLQCAALELVATSDSITEIAFRCGFSDSNYFKDAFKKKYGVTPRAYRKA